MLCLTDASGGFKPDPINKKRPRHSYTESQRLILCLCKRFFDISDAETAAVFNEVFEQELKAGGFADGLRFNVLQNQLHELKYLHGAYHKFSPLFDMSTKELRGLYFEHRNAIEDAASAIGIQLKMRIGPLNPQKAAILTKPRQKYRCQGSPVFEDYGHSEKDSDTEWYQRRKVRRVKSDGNEPMFKTNSKHLPTPLLLSDTENIASTRHNSLFQQILNGKRVLLKKRNDSNGTPILQRDTLLWRLYTAQSASAVPLRAGLFSHSPIFSPPGDIQLKSYVQSHLLREQTLSPLISLYPGPRPVFSRALRAKHLSARIVIIDFAALEASMQKRFPETKQTVFVVRKLIERFKLSSELNDFGLLAWATIEDAVLYDFPVTLLDSGPLSKLLQFDLLCSSEKKAVPPERFRPQAPIMDQETGWEIGRFLSLIAPYFQLKGSEPDQFKEVIAAKIATAWKFKGYETRNRKTYIDYMSGVFQVSNSTIPDFISISSDDEYDQPDSEKGLFNDDADLELEYGRRESAAAAQFWDDEATPCCGFDSDEEQELLDQQLAATTAEFAGDFVSHPGNQDSRSAVIETVTELHTGVQTSSPIDYFTLQLLESAKEPTPTAQSDEDMPTSSQASGSRETVIIDLTQDDDDDESGFGAGIGWGSESDNHEDEGEMGDTIVVDSTGMERSIFSMRTLSLDRTIVEASCA